VCVCVCVQEIVRMVVNSGQQFTEQQYVTVVSLSHRSEYASTDAELHARLAKLNAILTAGGSGPGSASIDTSRSTNGLP